MDFRKYLVLYCLNKINGERSIYGVLHILNGKKSSQTIQDSKLYQLSFLFQTLKDLKREMVEKDVQWMLKEGLLRRLDSDRYVLTESGVGRLRDFLAQSPFPGHLDGWRYGTQAVVFWDRLALTTQTLSHLLKKDHNFIPITKSMDTLTWVKRFMPREESEREHLASLIHQDLQRLLLEMDEQAAETFVYRMTGAHRIGLAFRQVAEHFDKETEEVILLFESVLHFMIKQMMQQRDGYPGLIPLVEDVLKPLSLTQSTEKTYELLMNGKTIEDVVEIRNLKKSTVEDHVVELALHAPEFDIEPFVPEELQRVIACKLQTMKTRRLKEIKAAMEDEVSYFHLRLMIAKEENPI